MPIHKPTPPSSFRPFALPPAAPPARSPGNDPSPPEPPPATFAAAVAHPGLSAYLHARLDPYGIPDADKADIAAAVKEGLWRCRGDADPACTMPRIFGLAKKVLDARLTDYWRAQAVRQARFTDGPTEPGDDEPEERDGPRDFPSYVDRLPATAPTDPERALLAKEQLAFVQRVAPEIGLTDDDVQVMWDRDDDEEATWDKLAAARGVSAERLRKRITRLREELNTLWSRALANPCRFPVRKGGGRTTI